MVDLATLHTLAVARGGPSAEQLLATSDGRLLVSNGSQVDVIAPLIAPSVRRTSPTDGSIVALPLSSITITFDRDMRRTAADAPDSVLNPDNYVLVNSVGTQIHYTQVSYDADSRTTTLRFESPAGDTYTLTVAKRIRSAAGLELVAPYTLTFDAVQDFSPLVDVKFVATRSDRATGTVSFDVQVTNVTAYDLRVPLLLVLDPSRYFQGTAIDAPLRPDGLWLLDIGAGLPNGVFAPHASTQVRTVTLTNPQDQHLNIGSGVYAMPYPNAVPVFTTQPLTDATAGVAYQYQATAVDPDGAVLTWVLLGGPANASLNQATGVLQWQPTAADKELQPVLLRVYDTRGGYATQAFTIDVQGGNRAPTLDLPATARLREGESFTLPVSASDPEGQVLSFLADHLPPGARFDSVRAVFEWTPGYSDAGEYRDVEFIVTDGTNLVTKSITFVVDQVNAPPVLNGIPDRTVRQGDPVLFTIHAEDVDGQPLTYSLVDAPPGATINPNTGVFTWAPAFDSALDLHGPFPRERRPGDGGACGDLHRPQRQRRAGLRSVLERVGAREREPRAPDLRVRRRQSAFPAADPAGGRDALRRRKGRRRPSRMSRAAFRRARRSTPRQGCSRGRRRLRRPASTSFTSPRPTTATGPGSR